MYTCVSFGCDGPKLDAHTMTGLFVVSQAMPVSTYPTELLAPTSQGPTSETKPEILFQVAG